MGADSRHDPAVDADTRLRNGRASLSSVPRLGQQGSARPGMRAGPSERAKTCSTNPDDFPSENKIRLADRQWCVTVGFTHVKWR